jgi:hypothetical protein
LLNLITAIFELLIGNTFAWTIFGSLGGYFMSLGVFFTPGFGVVEHYSTLHSLPLPANAPPGTPPLFDKARGISEFQNAIGMYNMCWAMMFMVFFIVALRTNIFMIFIFACVSVTCVCTGVAGFYKASAMNAVTGPKQKITKHMLELREEREHTAMIWDRVSQLPTRIESGRFADFTSDRRWLPVRLSYS